MGKNAISKDNIKSKNKIKRKKNNVNISDEKLFKRISTLFKSCAEGDSLCSSSINNSKVCLDVYTGVSIFNVDYLASPEIELTEENKMFIYANENVFNNMHVRLFQTKRKKLQEVHRSMSVYVYGSLISKSDYDYLLSCNGTIAIVSDNDNSVGSDLNTFGIQLPKNRWTHIALVCSDTPQNRVALYLVKVIFFTTLYIIVI